MGDWKDEIAKEERVDPPVHPGEVLKQEWLEPLGMNPNRLAKALGVDRQSIYEIVAGERGISADMALRLARWSGVRPAFWLGLQVDHDLRIAEWKRGREIAEQVEPLTRTG
jgi:addiction module HigA family antidote